jgi:hypothetical protein
MAGDADGARCHAGFPSGPAAVGHTPVRAEATGPGEAQPQIVGGQLAPDGKYPFMAVLTIQEAGGSYLCGGTLIDPNSVLTAAHCVVGADRINLAVGRTGEEPDGPGPGALRYQVVHPFSL